jgi:hypothetical protein
MKKIMFNDSYGLTKAVLEGRKTMTRRVVPEKMLDAYYDYDDFCTSVAPRDIPCFRDWEKDFFLKRSPFKVGEVVAVAQSYCTIVDELEDPRNFACMEHWESKSGERGKYAEMAMYSPGGTNKMFVLADEMPHQIRITSVRVERLQDISEDDCLREGIYNWKDAPDCPPGHKDSKIECYGYDGSWDGHLTPITAFAALIDKVSGKGTWADNPWVFVYEFELVK